MGGYKVAIAARSIMAFQRSKSTSMVDGILIRNNNNTDQIGIDQRV